jgi:hypothetical protein
MIRALDPAANYRAIYLTLWRMNERHDCAVHGQAANDTLSDVAERFAPLTMGWLTPGQGEGCASHERGDTQ